MKAVDRCSNNLSSARCKSFGNLVRQGGLSHAVNAINSQSYGTVQPDSNDSVRVCANAVGSCHRLIMLVTARFQPYAASTYPIVDSVSFEETGPPHFLDRRRASPMVRFSPDSERMDGSPHWAQTLATCLRRIAGPRLSPRMKRIVAAIATAVRRAGYQVSQVSFATSSPRNNPPNPEKTSMGKGGRHSQSPAFDSPLGVC